VITLADGVIRAGMLRGTYSAVGVTRAAAKSYRAGMALNNPLLPVSAADELSQKSLPTNQSFCSFESDNLVVSALKKAESGPGVVLRVYEIEGSPAESKVDFLGQTRRLHEVNLLEEELSSGGQQTLKAGPYEIKTFKLPTGAGDEAAPLRERKRSQ
jgi:alpha-mannosidase